MPTRNPTASLPRAAEAEQPAPRGVYAELIQLARSSASQHAFYGRALRCVARICASPYAVLHVALGSEVLQDECHFGPGDPALWKARVQRHLTEGLSERRVRATLLGARGAELRMCLVSTPLFSPEGASIGALAMIFPVDETDARPRVAFVESLAAMISYAAGHLGAPAGPPPATTAPDESIGRAAGFSTMEELAFNITNALRARLKCDQAALSLAQRQRVRILSISGLDDVRHNSPGAARIRSAMEECLDHGAFIAWSSPASIGADSMAGAHRLHRAWSEAAGGASVVSIPLFAGPRIAAILSLRRAPDRPFRADEIERIQKSVSPYAPALLLLRRATRGVLAHACESTKAALAALLQPGKAGRKVAIAVAVALAAWVAFGTLPYRITAPCVLAPAKARHVSVPFDGILASARVVAGERVRAGDVLCELDRRELELQQAEIQAQLAVAEHERLRAMAERSPVDAALAESNERLLRTRLQIVESRIERSRIRSPIDGIVVAGDLRQRVGGALRMGEPCFEVAPLSDWRVEVELPQYAAADVLIGQPGAYVDQARPEQPRALRIARVAPKSEAREGRSVFIAEAEVSLESDWLRPGMEGVARIEAGPRPVWWLAAHRVIDYLRANFWL
ncbi:MAG: HlyD family efflux transporter periplasmic adaptor subunit [Phycisphaerae bacterium]